MKHDTARPYLAAIILFEENGKIAHLLRHNTHWMNNHYGLPGGKVEHDETAIEAAVREAKEEVGVDVKPTDLKLFLTLYRKGRDSTAWVDLVFKAMKWKGKLKNAEPHKHKKLAWFEPDKLPKNIIPATRIYLESIATGEIYRDFGFKETGY